MLSDVPTFPREIADGIYWLGACNASTIAGNTFHLHLCQFVLVGKHKTMLIDTSTPSLWARTGPQLEKALGGRTLDYVFPTHPEVPHASALPIVLNKYPSAKVVTDVRDYHVFFPEFADRLVDKKPGDEIDLGGMQFVFLPALMKDLSNTLWGYERSRQVMFVSDGFSFGHSGSDMPESEDPLHRPGECAMTSSELGGVDSEKASVLLRAALYWSRFVEPELLFEGVNKLFEDYPTKLIAPAHGNVVDNISVVYPVIFDVHKIAFQSAMAGVYAEFGDTNAT